MRPYPNSHPQNQPSDTFHKRLNAYSLAGSATGLGLLALVQPSVAEVVYTPAHAVIGVGGVHEYNLDLNGDGVSDFVLEASNFCNTDQCFYNLFAKPHDQNGVAATPRGSFSSQALAMNVGSAVGPGQKFARQQLIMASYYLGGGGSSANGKWANVRDRFLGLAFRIDGQIHYGWARLSVRDDRLQISALLTGFAYESMANKLIRTIGLTEVGGTPAENGPDDAGNILQSASLGALALGAPGLAAWRRNER